MLVYRGVDTLITAMMLLEFGSPNVDDLGGLCETKWAGGFRDAETKALAMAQAWFRDLHGVWPETDAEACLAGECLFVARFGRGLENMPIPTWATLAKRLGGSVADARLEVERFLTRSNSDVEGRGVRARIILDYILTRRALALEPRLPQADCGREISDAA